MLLPLRLTSGGGFKMGLTANFWNLRHFLTFFSFSSSLPLCHAIITDFPVIFLLFISGSPLEKVLLFTGHNSHDNNSLVSLPPRHHHHNQWQITGKSNTPPKRTVPFTRLNYILRIKIHIHLKEHHLTSSSSTQREEGGEVSDQLAFLLLLL